MLFLFLKQVQKTLERFFDASESQNRAYTLIILDTKLNNKLLKHDNVQI